MEKEISHVAEVIISIVPIVGITFAAIIAFFALLWKHRENKLKIINETFKETFYQNYLRKPKTQTGTGLIITLVLLRCAADVSILIYQKISVKRIFTMNI